jgi:hypothetical protein
MKIGANGSKRWVEAFCSKNQAQTCLGQDFDLPRLFWSHLHVTIRNVDTSFEQGRSEVTCVALSSSNTTCVACCGHRRLHHGGKLVWSCKIHQLRSCYVPNVTQWMQQKAKHFGLASSAQTYLTKMTPCKLASSMCSCFYGNSHVHVPSRRLPCASLMTWSGWCLKLFFFL